MTQLDGVLSRRSVFRTVRFLAAIPAALALAQEQGTQGAGDAAKAQATSIDPATQAVIRAGRQMGLNAYKQTPIYMAVANMPPGNLVTTGIEKALKKTGALPNDSKIDRSIESASKTFHALIDGMPVAHYSMIRTMSPEYLKPLAARSMVLEIAAGETKRALMAFEGTMRITLTDAIPPNSGEFGREKLTRQVAMLDEVRNALKQANLNTNPEPVKELGEQTSHIAYNRAKIALDSLPAIPAK